MRGLIFRLRNHRLRQYRFRLSSVALIVLCVFAAISGGSELVRSTGIMRNDSEFVVSFDAFQKSSYRLERKLDLTDPSWQSIPGVNDITATSNGPAQIVDANVTNLGKAFYRVNLIGCDAALPSNSSDPFQYAAAMELCQITTEQGTAPGVISAALTLASGAGTPASVSRSIRRSFGNNNFPRAGNSMIVLSTGAAAAPGQANPSHTAFQPGLNTSTSSAAPADWLAANGGVFPVAPGCPSASGITAYNPVMLTLRVRVPSYAHSVRLSAKFFAADFPEYVCSPFSDLFVALLDSSYNGTPANPADKNLATYLSPNSARYPVGANLASDETGFFTDCVNGATDCSDGSSSGNITTCTNTSGLSGTGFDSILSGQCPPNSTGPLGGGTGWMSIRGNVVPDEIITLRFAIWDTADVFSDSLVLLDNFVWSAETVTPGTTLE